MSNFIKKTDSIVYSPDSTYNHIKLTHLRKYDIKATENCNLFENKYVSLTFLRHLTAFYKKSKLIDKKQEKKYVTLTSLRKLTVFYIKLTVCDIKPCKINGFD